MSASVNLLPAAIAESRARRARMRGWTIASCGVLGLFATVWVCRVVASSSEQRISRDVQECIDQTAAVMQEVVTLQTRAAAIAERLDRLLTHRSPTDWAARYAALAAKAPAGVALKELMLVTDARTQASAAPAGKAPTSAPAPVQRLAIVGYAVDHSAVTGFVDALARMPGCADVQLVGASSDERYSPYAVRFECTARSLEGLP